ncbi:MAG: hypothetical protein CMB37_06295 [Euryarchaeota archaeon]|nr:hypothetical protein [Euryarchaeota archaeon]MEC7704168.1 hypothetical protein [Candidatus Thermoplasmatota archaeon]MED5487475.1 hypothetical protein [Candidatus Thermoplasmatota archaeon]|tara:strand:+ start:623 stop:1063 length:441 start_codon:yes stop_codon:yes gene_type:complete
MMHKQLSEDDSGQMLLMTGLILMFALLTMSLNTVKTASLGEPYDAHEDAVLDASTETISVWKPLLENRSIALFESGSNETESAMAAAESLSDDLMRHGEIRGVEIILTDIEVVSNGSTRTVSANVGIADSHARLQFNLECTIDFES